MDNIWGKLYSKDLYEKYKDNRDVRELISWIDDVEQCMCTLADICNNYTSHVYYEDGDGSHEANCEEADFHLFNIRDALEYQLQETLLDLDFNDKE